MTHISNIQALDVNSVKSKVTEGFASFFISDAKQNEIMNSIFAARDKMNDANNNIDNANNELVKADTAQAEAGEKTDDAKTEEGNAKSKGEGTSEDSVSQHKTSVENSGQQADSSTQTIQNSQTQVEQTTQAVTQEVERTNQQLDSTSSQIQALILQSEAAAAEIENLQNGQNDGTGAGTSSAYSLSTGAQIQQQQQQSQSAIGTPDIEAQVASQMSIIQNNNGQIGLLTSQAAAMQQPLTQNINQNTAQITQAQSSAESSKVNGENAKSGIQQTLDVVGHIATVGDALDTAGNVLNAVGVGLQAAGVTTTATGGGVTATGGVLTGIGAGLTALGVPLCAFFGAGAPVVAGGSTTSAGGVTTTATGGTVIGAGGTLTSTGSAINATAKGLSTTGKAIKVATSATQTVANAAEGKWDKALTSAASLAVSSAATLNSFKGLSSATGGKFEQIANFTKQHQDIINKASIVGNTLKDGINTVKDIAEGASIEEIAADGFSAISYATGFGSSDRMSNIGDITRGLSSVAATIRDAKDPNASAVDLVFDSMSTLASFDAASARNKASEIERDLADTTKDYTDEQRAQMKAQAEYYRKAAQSESVFYKVSGKAQNIYDRWIKPSGTESGPVPVTAPVLDDGQTS